MLAQLISWHIHNPAISHLPQCMAASSSAPSAAGSFALAPDTLCLLPTTYRCSSKQHGKDRSQGLMLTHHHVLHWGCVHSICLQSVIDCHPGRQQHPARQRRNAYNFTQQVFSVVKNGIFSWASSSNSPSSSSESQLPDSTMLRECKLVMRHMCTRQPGVRYGQ